MVLTVVETAADRSGRYRLWRDRREHYFREALDDPHSGLTPLIVSLDIYVVAELEEVHHKLCELEAEDEITANLSVSTSTTTRSSATRSGRPASTLHSQSLNSLASYIKVRSKWVAQEQKVSLKREFLKRSRALTSLFEQSSEKLCKVIKDLEDFRWRESRANDAARTKVVDQYVSLTNVLCCL
jgi:hypothetical protein